MRLIDADALLEKMDTHCKLCPDSDGVHVCRRECDWHEAMDEVDDMDEIDLALLKEEPKQGRWEGWTATHWTGKYDDLGDPEYKPHVVYHCSLCGRRTVIREAYCPTCGARMGEDHA